MELHTRRFPFLQLFSRIVQNAHLFASSCCIIVQTKFCRLLNSFVPLVNELHFFYNYMSLKLQRTALIHSSIFFKRYFLQLSWVTYFRFNSLIQISANVKHTFCTTLSWCSATVRSAVFPFAFSNFTWNAIINL